MKRKDYQRPTMKVVRLQYNGMLMTSGVESLRSGYGKANSDVDEEELEEETGTWLWK